MYTSYYQLVAVHSQWTVQTLQTDSQKLVSSKLMKARKLNCSCSCPNKGPLWHICCKDIVVKSKPLGLDFYKAASCQQRRHGGCPSSPGIVQRAIAWGISCFLRNQPLMHQTIPIQRAEEERNDLNLASSLFSKRYLLHWHNSVFAYYISHLVDSSTSNCKWIPGYICTCAFRYSYHIMSYRIIFFMNIVWYAYMIETCLW